MHRAVDKLITLLKKVLSSSQSSSVGHGTGRLVGDQFDSLISNVKENPRRSSENEQIRILLERQREQILADCQAEIQKNKFQADYDRRSKQKLNEVIESRRGETYRSHRGDEQLRRDQQLLHEQLSEQNRNLRNIEEREMMDASEIYPQRINSKEELTTWKGEEFKFPSRR